ncbi:MAG TPA: bifunctional phosphoribosylaminoimidazolecarboxamide formyltransferase/IMP cyclohydrolase [Streptosporangiaceae bacterium]
MTQQQPEARVPIRRALVSVYDKAGVTELATALAAAGVEIVSTGSTAAAISAAGVPVTRVEDLTGFPECLDGRVKTLHPRVHAGLLADLSLPTHRSQLADLGIEPFELLVSNLYPFEQALASGAGHAECVEQIDIGGPAMVRAAAKNHATVAVCTDPASYPEAVAAAAGGGFTLAQRRRLAARAFAHTAAYDAAIASWFASAYAPDETAAQTGWPETISAAWTRKETLRYGENPHQRAALYLRGPAGGAQAGLAGAEQLHGKAMSYNNYVDADAARRAAFDFAEPCVAIMKHSNPCGIAVGTDLAQAHRKANDCDPVSAYGGVIAANAAVTAALAEQIAAVFTEVLVAPGFEPAALDILTTKKNLRLLRCPAPAPAPAPASGPHGAGPAVEWRQISGGLLVQSADQIDQDGDQQRNWRLAAGPPAPDALRDLAFAWRACRAVKSNAILLAAGQASVGIGMGQVNRVDSARLAVGRAGDRAKGAVAASDAFFPFADGLQVLADAGVRAVAEPGGSIHDDEVIAAAQEAGLSLYFTGVRHFFH